MARNAARFGSDGAYKCGICGRRTRQTGGDNHGVGLCAECYELAGIENGLSDCGGAAGLAAQGLLEDYRKAASAALAALEKHGKRDAWAWIVAELWPTAEGVA